MWCPMISERERQSRVREDAHEHGIAALTLFFATPSIAIVTHAAQPLLAQAGESSSVFLWSAVLIGVVLLLFLGVVWARKRLSPDEDFSGEGFTLSDLRAMVKQGKLTEEEYDRAKEKMVAAMHAAQARQEAARQEAAKQRQQ